MLKGAQDTLPLINVVISATADSSDEKVRGVRSCYSESS